jgi:hypothetical protein
VESTWQQFTQNTDSLERKIERTDIKTMSIFQEQNDFSFSKEIKQNLFSLAKCYPQAEATDLPGPI